jgi:excisionase family DNA binding protein
MSEPQEEGWLSLQEASTLLGVSTSTLRRWGDQGHVPMKRTLGGHRRFLRLAIEQLREKAPQAALVLQSPAPSWQIDSHSMQRQDWHARLMTRPGGERMRGLGQRLLGLLVQFINRREADERFLAEARAVGLSYGAEGRIAGHQLHDIVQAFLFFRQTFAQSATPLPGITRPTDISEIAELRERIERFMDAVLMGTVDGYESEG